MDKKYRPKQYTHINYEALVIYAMKYRVSIEQAMEDFNIRISRSTVVRNISKLSKAGNKVIDLYQNGYVPNMQKDKLPEKINLSIQKLNEKQVINGNELDDTYKKLSTIEEIIKQCNGNASEAIRRINSGKTILGNVKPITVQAILKDMKYLDRIRKQLEEKKNNTDNNEQEK